MANNQAPDQRRFIVLAVVGGVLVVALAVGIGLLLGQRSRTDRPEAKTAYTADASESGDDIPDESTTTTTAAATTTTTRRTTTTTTEAPTTTTKPPIPDDLPAGVAEGWCDGSCAAAVSTHLDHPRYGPGTLAIFTRGDAELVSAVFTSDDPSLGPVWGRQLSGTDLFIGQGRADSLHHLFLPVGFGGPGSLPLVIVPTADGFSDLGTGDVAGDGSSPFGGSDYVSPFDDVDGDGRIEIINVSKGCATSDCNGFTWSRSVWTWNGSTFVKTTNEESIPPPDGW